MSQSNGKVFWSKDKKFGISITPAALDAILHHCRSSGNLETGGILIGKYSEEYNCALVSEVTGPPKDSKRSPTTFERGTHGLKILLDECFRARQTFYLGEWHFHPNASAEPSGRDLNQLREIANSERFKCPEPDLVIIGGNPSGAWTITAHVVPKSEEPIRLIELPPEDPNFNA